MYVYVYVHMEEEVEVEVEEEIETRGPKYYMYIHVVREVEVVYYMQYTTWYCSTVYMLYRDCYTRILRLIKGGATNHPTTQPPNRRVLVLMCL